MKKFNQPIFDLFYENTGITKDDSDYYHITIDRENWQALYRVRGDIQG